MENNLIVQLEEKINRLIEKAKQHETENISLKEEIERLKNQKEIINGRIDKLLEKLEDIG